jgi:hypothetical protein
MEIIKIISVNDIDEIVEKIVHRQEKFDEDLRIAIGMVLINYGDGEVRVRCTGKEWHGTKSDIQNQNPDGVPLCPSGHPLFETSVAPRLALLRLEE